MRIIIETDDGQKTSHEILSAPGAAPATLSPAAGSSTGGAIDAGPGPGAALGASREAAASAPGAPVAFTQEAESAGVAPSLGYETGEEE